jgi:YidC/Oxa1 family membrane protein insertase
MQEMQKLQPHMKKIQEKYKKNPKEMQKRIMDLYREHKINPLSGCLPLIVQMPILIILYQSVMSIKTQFINGCLFWNQNSSFGKVLLFTDTKFLWMPSLLIPDFPLLILYALSMYISQKLTVMPTVDKAQLEQQKMMAWMMPLLFTVMFRSFPAAFILYWLTFNILSTAQQLFVMKKFPSPIIIPEKEEKK